MAESTTPQNPEAPVVGAQPEAAPPTRLQLFVIKHPRLSRVAAITSVLTAVLGVFHITRTVKANRKHLEQAGDHAKEALNEVSTAVSPPPDPEA